MFLFIKCRLADPKYLLGWWNFLCTLLKKKRKRSKEDTPPTHTQVLKPLKPFPRMYLKFILVQSAMPSSNALSSAESRRLKAHITNSQWEKQQDDTRFTLLRLLKHKWTAPHICEASTNCSSRSSSQFLFYLIILMAFTYYYISLFAGEGLCVWMSRDNLWGFQGLNSGVQASQPVPSITKLLF